MSSIAEHLIRRHRFSVEDYYRMADDGILAPDARADILLLIEVADTSLRLDRDLKVGLYARSGIREVWLLDLNARAIRRYRAPSATGYLESESPAMLAAVPVPGLVSTYLDLFGLL